MRPCDAKEIGRLRREGIHQWDFDAAIECDIAFPAHPYRRLYRVQCMRCNAAFSGITDPNAHIDDKPPEKGCIDARVIEERIPVGYS